jgi:hypothetical protein
MKPARETLPAERTLDSAPAPVRFGEGLLAAHVGRRGKWAALRSLHAAMADVRKVHGEASLSFIMALAGDGRLVSGRDPDAAVFLLGYRLR